MKGNYLRNNSKKAKEIGSKGGKNKKGKLAKKTLIKIALGLTTPEKLATLKDELDKQITDFLYDRSKSVRFAAFKEIMKYVHAQKKTLDVTGIGIQSNNIFVVPAFKNSISLIKEE
jgi:HEAT repeat protein